jgi:hypothetical protein
VVDWGTFSRRSRLYIMPTDVYSSSADTLLMNHDMSLTISRNLLLAPNLLATAPLASTSPQHFDRLPQNIFKLYRIMTTTAKLDNGLPDPLIGEIMSLKAALARYQVIVRASNSIYRILLFFRIPQTPPIFTCSGRLLTFRH